MRRPGVQIVVSSTIFQQREPVLLENDSRIGAGNTQDEPGTHTHSLSDGGVSKIHQKQLKKLLMAKAGIT